MPPAISNRPSVLLTATIEVQPDMSYVARRDTDLRLADYKEALTKWLKNPFVQSVIFVENSRFDLSELKKLAESFPSKRVEFLSFQSPAFDGQLGKGYGEALILQYALEHSTFLKSSPVFIKASGRYYHPNVGDLIYYIEEHPELDVVCDLLKDLTLTDSRVFACHVDFLQRYFFPLRERINDTNRVWFEHVLASAIHLLLADGGRWSMMPVFPEIEGVSGTMDTRWKRKSLDKIRKKIKHDLLFRLLKNKEV